MIGRLKRLDWTALITGAIVACLSIIPSSAIVPVAEQITSQAFGKATASSALASATIQLFFAAFPGAIVAGYLHSTKLSAGAYYGLGAAIMGVIIPFLGMGFLILAFLFAPLAHIIVLVWAADIAPVIAVVIIGGLGGGILGSLMKRKRVEASGP